MDPKKLEDFCRQHAEVIRHADARTVDKRVHLEESESQPLVVKRLLPWPHECEDCGKQLADRKVRNHFKKKEGWRSHCSGCNRVRQPGSDVFGQTTGVKASERGFNHLGPRPELLPEPIQPLLPDPQSDPIENAPSEHFEPVFVEQVTVREYHESVIKEYSRIQVYPPGQQCDAPVPDSEVRKG